MFLIFQVISSCFVFVSAILPYNWSPAHRHLPPPAPIADAQLGKLPPLAELNFLSLPFSRDRIFTLHTPDGQAILN